MLLKVTVWLVGSLVESLLLAVAAGNSLTSREVQLTTVVNTIPVQIAFIIFMPYLSARRVAAQENNHGVLYTIYHHPVERQFTF